MNAKSKAFAFISVALMICGAFVCLSVTSDDSSAVGESASNPIYIPLSTKTFTATPGTYYEIQLCDPDALSELELSLYLYLSDHVYGNNPGEGDIEFVYSETHDDCVITSFPSGLTGTGRLEFYFSEGYATNNSDTRNVVFSLPQSTVSFNSMGGTGVAPQNVTHGGCATIPANPTNGVNVFGGWFTDQACTQAFNFSTPIYNDIILYAKWTTPNASVTSSHGNSTMTVGQLFSYNVSTSPGNATISVSGANWLTVSGHTIYGTPTSPGTYNVTITSSASGYNSGSQSFTITVSSVLAPGNTPSNGVIAYVR